MAKKLEMLAIVFLVCALGVGTAGTPAIGFVKANGDFRMDNAAVHGNGTLFDGSTLETGKTVSELRLNNGARVLLSSGTRSRIYRDRMLLERGAGRMEGGKYAIEARTLRIRPVAEGAIEVAFNRDNRVQVAALSGPAEVRNAAGVLVANVVCGSALEFEPQAAGAAAASHVTGCLERKGGKYFVKDETTHVYVQLEGPGLELEVGNQVEVTGAMVPGAKPAAGASQLINVSEVKGLGRKCSTGGKKAAGAGAAGAGAAAGLPAGAVVAVVGGVAAAATVGGLYAAGTIGGGESKPGESR